MSVGKKTVVKMASYKMTVDEKHATIFYFIGGLLSSAGNLRFKKNGH